LSEDTWSCSSY